VCGVELALSHVGSQFLIVRDAPCSYNEGPAEIIISVDGVVERTEVFLPHGVRPKCSCRPALPHCVQLRGSL